MAMQRLDYLTALTNAGLRWTSKVRGCLGLRFEYGGEKNKCYDKTKVKAVVILLGFNNVLLLAYICLFETGRKYSGRISVHNIRFWNLVPVRFRTCLAGYQPKISRSFRKKCNFLKIWFRVIELNMPCP